MPLAGEKSQRAFSGEYSGHMLIGEAGHAVGATSFLCGASGHTWRRQADVATLAGVTMSVGDAAAIDIGDGAARSENLRASWRNGAFGLVTVRQ